jgi:NitT/TauT family transport system ATP-binding protein
LEPVVDGGPVVAAAVLHYSPIASAARGGTHLDANRAQRKADREGAANVDGNFLDVEAVDKVYPTHGGSITALRNATLSVGRSEFVSLLGPSGCGKSTLLRCIAGLERPSAGRISLHGEETSEPPADLGMVFQRDVLLDWLTVESNILLPSRIKGYRAEQWRPKARALLDAIGLAGFENQFPWELSGGMRQRVAICRALLLDPVLLVMDEPFGAIDAMTRDELNLELQHIWLRNAKTVLFVTHSIPEAVFLSDRIIVMSRSPGRVVDSVTVDLARPRPLSIRETPEFGRYVARIREIFETFGMLRRSHGRD